MYTMSKVNSIGDAVKFMIVVVWRNISPSFAKIITSMFCMKYIHIYINVHTYIYIYIFKCIYIYMQVLIYACRSRLSSNLGEKPQNRVFPFTVGFIY